MRFITDEATCLERARAVKLVAMDVDGTLTDGRIGYGCGSADEIKFFDVRDGSAIKLMMASGIAVGVITGRKSTTNRTRAAELKLDFMLESVLRKEAAIAELAASRGFTLGECVYIGDDWIDAGACRACGLGVAVGDAEPDLLEYADLQTSAFGGRGAVREFGKWLLTARGCWRQAAQKRYGL